VASSVPAVSEAGSIVNTRVAPLRAGQGFSFFLRRLHSLSGVIPVGAFLVEHILSNSFATRGPAAYNKQVEFLVSFPFVLGLEIFGIWLPILFHALYGFYIWWRGDSNLTSYPWMGNWMYTAQRWTGGVAFAYIAFHTWEMRFTGVHLMENPHLAFAKVQESFHNPLIVLFYMVGLICASWHFAYGLWLFAAKWGITSGDLARKRFGFVCAAIGLVLLLMGLASIFSFIFYQQQPLDSAAIGQLDCDFWRSAES
jgi:succinate dehydrogenase / fumarate reductase cytochrome b subunit